MSAACRTCTLGRCRCRGCAACGAGSDGAMSSPCAPLCACQECTQQPRLMRIPGGTVQQPSGAGLSVRGHMYSWCRSVPPGNISLALPQPLPTAGSSSNLHGSWRPAVLPEFGREPGWARGQCRRTSTAHAPPRPWRPAMVPEFGRGARAGHAASAGNSSLPAPQRPGRPAP